MQSSHVAPKGAGRTGTLIGFILGHSCLHLCTGALVPLLPMVRDGFGLDYFRSGLLLSAFTVAYGLCQIPMALLSDRFSKRRVISLGLLGTGAACIGAGLSADYSQLLLSLVLLGIAGSGYHAPSSAFLSQTFAKEERGRALGLHLIGGSTGLMLAPVVSILVANLTGNWRYSFLVMGIPVLLAGAMIWTLARAQEIANVKAVATEPASPLNVSALLKALGLAAVVAWAMQLLTSGMNSYIPLYLVDKHGTPRDLAGLMVGLVYGAGLVGAPLGGDLSDRIGRKPVIIISVITVGPLMLLVSLLPFGPGLIGAIVVYGMLVVFRSPAMESLIADVSPARRRATVMGAYHFLAHESSGISTPLFGAMMDRYGANEGFGLLAAFSAFCSLLVLLFHRQILGASKVRDAR